MNVIAARIRRQDRDFGLRFGPRPLLHLTRSHQSPSRGRTSFLDFSASRFDSHQMSQERPAKRLRKGAKSCVECRERKVGCVWPSNGGDTCVKCLARGRVCELQSQMTSTEETVKQTSRARIGHLEEDVSGLWSAVRNLEAKLGCSPSQGYRARPPSPGRDGPDPKFSDDKSNSDSSDLSPPNPPTHLLQLFDNGLLDTCQSGLNDSRHNLSGTQKIQGRSELRRLMPMREGMLMIVEHASSWLYIYNALFPMSNMMKTSDDFLAKFDELQDPDADVIEIAALLLCIAITVQQEPDGTAGIVNRSTQSASAFVKEVSNVVESVVILDDTLAGTLKGIDTSLLYVRLQLGRSRIKKTWLTLRRVIALAEMIGLPRASLAASSIHISSAAPSNDHQVETSGRETNLRKQRAEMWQSICAVDRITSMMWSLPLATSQCPLPKQHLMNAENTVNPQGYLYGLAEVAARVHELDNMQTSGKSQAEVFNVVLSTDQELRTLSNGVPKGWWRDEWTGLRVDAILQYWHHYMIVRAHLQLALTSDEGQRFNFNFITCFDACQELARRYVLLRPALPPGFFAGCVIDLQVFTAVVFLLLASSGSTRGSAALAQMVDSNMSTSLTDSVIQVLDHAAKRHGGDFACRAADAARSLRSLLQRQQDSESQNMTLNLPLVGKIHVSRRSDAMKLPNQQCRPTVGATMDQQSRELSHVPPEQYTPALEAIPLQQSDLQSVDGLSYSMEIPESYSFLSEETLGLDSWLTLGNFNSDA